MSIPPITAHRQQVELWQRVDALTRGLTEIQSSVHFTMEDLQVLHKAYVPLMELRNRVMTKIQTTSIE